MATETLAHQEQAVDSQRTPLRPSTQPMTTQDPSGAVVISGDVSAPNDASRTTQLLLQNACKPKTLSSSGTKKELLKRLETLGVHTASDVRNLAKDSLEQGADASVEASVTQKAPNCIKHEDARQCHVIADPRHSTAVGRLYNKFESRAEYEQGQHDPWSAEFVELFNSDSFMPDISEPHDGVTDDTIMLFNPKGCKACIHPHIRNGAFLKSRWNKIRSKYKIAREKYTRSRQGNDVFDNFTDGDDNVSYMHCVFHGLPALEAIVRTLPPESGDEGGLEEISNAKSVSQDIDTRAKKRKLSKESSLAESLIEVARAVTAPVEINISEQKEKGTRGQFYEFDMSDRIADTVTKLMNLKDSIRSNLRNALVDGDEEYIEELRGRLYRST